MATITISRPERRNALRIETYAELAAALEEAGANDQVGVVVITTRVNELTALAGDPQIQANGYFERLPHPVLKEWMYVTTPLDFSRTPVSIAAALRSRVRTMMKCSPSGWAFHLRTSRGSMKTK